MGLFRKAQPQPQIRAAQVERIRRADDEVSDAILFDADDNPNGTADWQRAEAARAAALRNSTPAERRAAGYRNA